MSGYSNVIFGVDLILFIRGWYCLSVFAQISIFFTFINNFTDTNFDVESTTEISNSLHNVVFKELGLLTGYQDNVLEYNHCTGNYY